MTYEQWITSRDAAVETLRKAAGEFGAGKITEAELKKTTAPLGIYAQRNGLFMVRVRLTGGRLSTAAARELTSAARSAAATRFHLTTRQDIQIHDVPAANVAPLVAECNRIGLSFWGGGGDTYRNITACHKSGDNASCVFDVQPYALWANDLLRLNDQAVKLPRKLKVGFACCPASAGEARLQDLGLLAAVDPSGRHGFKVFVGGGMGRYSAAGFVVHEFIPVEELPRHLQAVTALFHDHGDRADRAKARLRFVAQKLGQEAFAKLYDEYLHAVKPSLASTQSPGGRSSPKGESLTRIFIPFGDLGITELDKLIDTAKELGCEEFRVSIAQDLWAASPSAEASQELASRLSSLSPSYVGGSLVGVTPCCVGSNVCKIGLLDSRSLASKIGREFDKLLTADPANKPKLLDAAERVLLSGCANSCGRHRCAPLGVEGCRKGTDGKPDLWKVWVGGDPANDTLASPLDDTLRTDDEVIQLVISRALANH